jgi:two-component system cell cycle sensor histidine kinase/response regulator CckA
LNPLEFNPTDLNQILLNLIINARDALQSRLTKPQLDEWTPRIVVQAEEAPASMRVARPEQSGNELLGWQVLTVEDNGTGIPADIIDRIFEPFFTTKEVGQGTGIGLSTIWHLVTAAGGTITVESRVGEGTQFHVVLPRWKTQRSSVRTSIPPPLVDAPPLRVFLAEDDRLLARACTRGLTGLGHEVTHVTNGLDAWHAFENRAGESHDVLLTDVNMPRMNGLDLIRRVRITGFRGRVIVMSGRVDAESLAAIKALQVDYVLAKPFTITRLVAAVSNTDCAGANFENLLPLQATTPRT